MGQLFAFLALFLIIYIVILIIRIPIIIAKSRGIEAADLTTVAILSWLGILFGITWIAALILSLIYETAPQKKGRAVNADELGKLYDLKKKGAITPQEYDRYKENFLK